MCTRLVDFRPFSAPWKSLLGGGSNPLDTQVIFPKVDEKHFFVLAFGIHCIFYYPFD